MVSAISGPAYTPYAYSPAPTPMAANATHSSTSTFAADTFDPNKQAGFMKRMGNGIGNMFSSMADLIGMGQISHFAKENFDLADADRNNRLNTQEFTLVSQLTGISFAQADKDGDQSLGYNEFKSVASTLVKSLFQRADTSADGFVNFAEAQATGYVVQAGNSNTFAIHDSNQDGLLSRKEFIALADSFHIKNKYR